MTDSPLSDSEGYSQRISSCHVLPTESYPRELFYAPNMDGSVDPGEVVWFWAPPSSADEQATERAMVVVGRSGPYVVGLATSTNREHATETTWLDIGSGPWDDAHRRSWVRLDKIVKVPEAAIRRQGALIPEHRFNRIADRLRRDYGWS